MGFYTTEDRVGFRLRTNFDASSEPSAGEVEEIISEVENIIDSLSGRTYKSNQTATNEYHDYSGVGFIVTKNPGLLSVTLLEYTLDSGSTWTTIPSTSYDVYTDFDTIELKPDLTTNILTAVPSGNKKIRVTYTYGATSVPLRIRNLATDMACLEVIKSLVNQSANTAGGTVQVGPIRVTEPGSFSVAYVTKLQQSIAERLNGLGGSRIKTTVARGWF